MAGGSVAGGSVAGGSVAGDVVLVVGFVGVVEGDTADSPQAHSSIHSIQARIKQPILFILLSSFLCINRYWSI